MVIFMEKSQGQYSTIVITILGFLVALYFIYKGAIDGYLQAQGLEWLIAGIAFIATTIWNYAKPRMGDLQIDVKEEEVNQEEGA